MSGKQEDYEDKCEEAIALVKRAKQLLDSGNFAQAAEKYQAGLDLLDALLSVDLDQRNLGPDTKKRLYYLQGHLERMRKGALAGFAEAQIGATPRSPGDTNTMPDCPPSYEDVLREDSLRRSAGPPRAPPQYNDQVFHQESRLNEQYHDQQNASSAGNLCRGAWEEPFPDKSTPSAPPMDNACFDPTLSPQPNIPTMSPQPNIPTMSPQPNIPTMSPQPYALPIHPHIPTSPQHPYPYRHSTPSATLPQIPEFNTTEQLHMTRTPSHHSSDIPSSPTGTRASGSTASSHSSPSHSSQLPVATGSQRGNSGERITYPNLDYLHLEDTTTVTNSVGGSEPRTTTRRTASLNRISARVREILRINRGVHLFLVSADGRVTCPLKDTCLVITGPRHSAGGVRRSLSGVPPVAKRVLTVGNNYWATNLSFDSTFVLYALGRYFAFKTSETKDTSLVVLDVEELRQRDKDQLAFHLKQMTFLKTLRKKGVATKITTGLEKVAQKGVAATAKVDKLVKRKQPKFHLKTQKAREISVKAAKLCGSTLSRGMHSLADMVDNTEELSTEDHKELYFAVENVIRSPEINTV